VLELEFKDRPDGDDGENNEYRRADALRIDDLL
jgi:hypothetical protein